ncbi:Aste57867_21421 [Aphanomyces stellatus]|uniref:Aste57867_21421 protein n=1 Tax=Aphanomyces stellatus TaxID=120398 RepID=A0A485LM14_9STRA|nr:hypothetical protein As57867_021352 [Aphanomyces stellatus]VFT98092.1 Aste57867_21421 [Aphanomyces stellatus]
MDAPPKRRASKNEPATQDVPLDSYNRALRKGRHPRSFGRDATSTIWTSLKSSTTRVSNVRTGQGLGSIVDKESESFALESTATAGASPERDDASASRQSISRSKGKAFGSPVEKEKRRAKKKHHGHEDVIKRLQALGSSDLKTPASTSATAGSTPTSIAGTAASSAASATAADVVDTIKMRNDFSAQNDARIYYGCTVAFELFNGDLLMVSVADSTVGIRPLEHIKHQAKGARDKLLFTLVNLHELRSANPIKYGDSVWLQLSVGTGETSWEQGGVLGAKVRKAPELNTLSLTHGVKSDDPTAAGDSEPELINVGYPVPVKAFLPKSREDSTDSQIDDMQARLRNKTSRMLGRWIIRSAVANSNAKDTYVYNNHEVYLEQDWFYLGADLDVVSKTQLAVLRQLPPPKTYKPGEYIVERRAAWKLRLVDSSNGGLGLSLVQQQMERLLFKAKTQLKASERMRDGDLRRYDDDLCGGQRFSKQLRQHIQNVTTACDRQYLGIQHDRMSNLNQYFENKFAALDTGRHKKLLSPIGSRGKQHDVLRQSVSHPTLSLGGDGSASTSQIPSSSSLMTSNAKKPCNLCIANERIGFNLCTHDHEVTRLLAHGAALPSATPHMHKSSSERSLLTTGEMAARVRQAEAADLRERDRIMRMLTEQDARLVGVIKTSEHQTAMALIQKRTHDFTEDEQAIFFSSAGRQKRRNRSSADGLPDIDTLRKHLTESPPVLPVDGDADGVDDDDEDALEMEDDDDDDDGLPSSDSDDDFITEDEIQTLEYVNTNKACALYANDEKALVEMLMGFADLAQQRIVPQLRDAMAAHNKASLLETADFLARAAEFVVARRIQVHVMGLIQSVATSNVDDFEGIGPTLSHLIEEIHGTVHFAQKYKLDLEKKEAEATAAAALAAITAGNSDLDAVLQ